MTRRPLSFAGQTVNGALRRLRVVPMVLCAVLVAAPLSLLAVPTTSASADTTSSFTAGDIVVYRVGSGEALSGAAAPVFLDEYSPSGVLLQSVALPTVAASGAGTNKALVASGTANSEGLLSLSADGRDLVATGYNDTYNPTDSTNPSSAASSVISRTVGLVGADDAVNTTTSLTDEATGNNVRSAVSDNGQEVWVSGADAANGVRYAPVGASSSTGILASSNGRQAGIYDGQLYVSADPTKNGKLTVASVGAGLPKTGTVTGANLSGLPGSTFEPYQYSFANLGPGSAPDTLYIAENTSGTVEKWSLSGSTWTLTGSVSVPGVTAVAAEVNGGVATLFAANGTSLDKITDSSGLGGSLTGTAVQQIASVGTNEAFRGVAFAPGTVLGNGGATFSAPAITSGASATFTEGSAGSFTVTTTGSPAPALDETGSLPNGVTFTDNGDGTATLAGTPTGTGTFTISIAADNGVVPDAAQSFTLQVDGAAAPPAITSGSSTSFTIGSAGSFLVTTTGTPTPALSESGPLPTGVTFTDNGDGTATLAGTPAGGTTGSYPFTIDAGNGVAPDAIQSFTLNVAGAPPTISTTLGGLPAAIGDPTNPTLGVTVGSSTFDPSQLDVTATSSDPTVAASASVATVAGSGGADRTLTVTPGTSVGDATITLTVTDPAENSATTTVAYGLSAEASDPDTARYFSGSGNLSTAIDVGDGYFLGADDENNVIRLYQWGTSGPPVNSFDFTSQLPFGNTEIDIEAAARTGNTIYWLGSMSNSSSGKLEPARSTLFETTVSGSGADATLSYVGSYTGLRSDLINWDEQNNNPLGFAADAAAGNQPKQADGFNAEGMEFAPGSSSTVYIGFRAPVEGTDANAVVVPLTNVGSLITAGNNTTSGQSTFGNAMQWDLQGNGIREIRKNADNQYLIIAGSFDDTNAEFPVYQWDGVPGDAPRLTGDTIAGVDDGAWESIVSVPDPLTAGATLRLVEDNGDTVWYNDGLTSKTGMEIDLQKDLGDEFTFQPPSLLTPTTPVISDLPAGGTFGDGFTATVSTTGDGTTSVTSNAPTVCTADGLNVSYVGTGICSLTAHVAAGTNFAAADGTPQTFDVTPATWTVTVTGDQTYGGSPSFTAAPDSGPTQPYGGTLTCTTVNGGTPISSSLAADGGYTIDSASCSGLSLTGADASDYTLAYSGSTFTVDQDASAITLQASANPDDSGQPVTFTAAVTAGAPGSGTPTGSATWSITSQGGVSVACSSTGSSTTGSTLTETCSTAPGALVASGAPYAVTVTYSGDTNFTGSSTGLVEQVQLAAATVKAKIAKSGSKVTVTAKVKAPPGGSVPTGTVTFVVTNKHGTVINCKRGNIWDLDSSGEATCSLSGLSAANSPYSVIVVYPGNADYGRSVSAPKTFTG